VPKTLVDVHWIDLEAATPDLGYWGDLLDSEERAHAQRFRFDRDRRHYVVRHGWLRELLSQRLEISPRQIRFSRNGFGKPSLPGRDLRFNLSRSGGRALCVLAEGLELGCDLEQRNPELATSAVAGRFFSPCEQATLWSLPPDLWVEGFFNCWTRKEAYIKARGLGFSYPLDAFDVSLAPGEPARLMRGCQGWSVQSFEPAPGFAAAVVAQGLDWALSMSGEACLGQRSGSG
jgi:4'-phosphopantetheinyl transferase